METKEIIDLLLRIREENETEWLKTFDSIMEHYFSLADSKTKEKLYSEFSRFYKKIQNEIDKDINEI